MKTQLLLVAIFATFCSALATAASPIRSELPTITGSVARDTYVRNLTISGDGKFITTKEQSQNGNSEATLELWSDFLVINQTNAFSTSRTLIDLKTLSSQVKADQVDALTQSKPSSVLVEQSLASSCSNALSDFVSAADIMASACGTSSSSSACQNAIRIYRDARDTLMRCMNQMK